MLFYADDTALRFAWNRKSAELEFDGWILSLGGRRTHARTPKIRFNLIGRTTAAMQRSLVVDAAAAALCLW